MTAQLTLPQSSFSQSSMAIFEKIQFFCLAIGFSTFIYLPNIFLASILFCWGYRVCTRSLPQVFVSIEKKIILYLSLSLCCFVMGCSYYNGSGFELVKSTRWYVQFILLFLILMQIKQFHTNSKRLMFLFCVSILPCLFLYFMCLFSSASFLFIQKYLHVWPNGFATVFFHGKNARAIFVAAMCLLSFNLSFSKNIERIEKVALGLVIFLSYVLLYHEACRASIISLILGGCIQLFFLYRKEKINVVPIFAIVMVMVLIAWHLESVRSCGLIQHIYNSIFTSQKIPSWLIKRKQDVLHQILMKSKAESQKKGVPQSIFLDKLAQKNGFESWQKIKRVDLSKGDPGKNIRCFLYSWTLSHSIKHLWFGDSLWSFQQTYVASDKYKRAHFISNKFYSTPFGPHPGPHSLLLRWFYQGGILFLIGNIVLVILCLRRGLKSEKKLYLFTPIIVLFIAGQFTFIFSSPRPLFLLYTLLAWSCGFHEYNNKKT